MPPRSRPMFNLPGPLAAVPGPGGRTIYRPLDPDEYSSCLNASTVMAVTQDCIMRRFERFYYVECQGKWLYDGQLDDVIPALLATCQSFGVRTCDEPSCVQNREMLDEFVPHSEYFPCLREWVLQVVACNKSQTPGPPLRPHVRARKEPGSVLDSDTEPLTEVLSLLSWFGGFFDSYQAISPPPPLRLVAGRDASLIEEYGVKRMRREIDNALERLKAYNICPQRAWVAVSTLPGGELNLPALIPDYDSPVADLFLDRDRWDEDREHAICTIDHCEYADIDATDIPQLHVCDLHDCELTRTVMFPRQKLVDAIERKQLTAWTLDGLSIFGGNAFNRDFSSKKEPFIAISHVWADGTGEGKPQEMKRRVRSCLFKMFCDIARQLGCRGVWWDAICIPGRDSRDLRNASLAFMEKNYSAAKYTVVHDLYLRKMPWVDAESASLALVLSPWFSRGWTALEFSRSDKIYVIFAKTDDPSGYVLKNLDEDILTPMRVGGSACQLVARAIIQTLRKETRAYLSPWSPGPSYGKIGVNDLLISLKGRSTSWPRDQPIIACLLAEVELPANPSSDQSSDPPPDPNLCRTVLQGRGIRAQNLFHEAEAAKGFGWQPMSLLDLPVCTRDYSAKLRISPAPPKTNSSRSRTRGRSDVVGLWSFICDPSHELQAFRKVCFEWPEPGEDEKANEARDRIRKAITDAVRSTKHHVILVDRNQRYPSRGILVKVKKWSNETTQPSNVQEIFGRFNNLREQISFPCEFVGVVRFSSCELPIMGPVTFVLFGTNDENLGKDLGQFSSAWSFIRSKVPDLRGSSVFATGQNNVGTWSGETPEENIWEEGDSTGSWGRTSGREDVQDLLIPRMRVAKFASPDAGDFALSGCDRIQLSHPDGLLIPEYTN